MKPKLRKIGSIFTATLVACALFLTGTFAWQSISQEALNEKEGVSNPGGRLHDDFNGTNKDVYVENFTDEETGVPIFARIRLQEYMEMGAEAGKKKEESKRKVTVLGKTEGTNPDIKKPSTWHVHKQEYIPSSSTGVTNPETVFHDYWTLEWGGKTTYMPTFNKNKDSLEADINGTLKGEEGKNKPYSDYKEWQVAQEKSDTAVYDADDNTVDEKEGAVDGEHVTKKEEIHVAKETVTGTVITMAQWKEQGAKAGPYWVYDTDGWAYWAEAIMPQTATGLLLSGIQMERQPDEDWYYAINVVGQFATSGDWGTNTKGSETGFYKDGMTDDGLLVLNTAAKRLPTIAHMQPKKGYKQYVKAGEKLTLEVDLDIKNPTGSLTESHVIWTCDPKTSALSGNTFTPNSNMVGQTFKLTATSNIDKEKTTTMEVYVYPADAVGVVQGKLDGNMYVKFADNTFKPIQENGQLGEFICGGADEEIGTYDDNQNVYVLTDPNPDFGTKFLGPEEGGTYWAVGPDKKLGTKDDIKVVGSPWPQNITNRLADDITITTASGKQEAKVGKQLQLNANITLQEQKIAVQDVTWKVSGNTQEGTTIDENGVLTVDPNETVGNTLTVYAESKEMKGLETNIRLTVVPLGYEDIRDVEIGSTTTVTIDGIEWYVLKRDGKKALLLARKNINADEEVKFGTNVEWKSSAIKTNLNGSFLINKTTLKAHVVTTGLETWNGTTWISTNDDVFLLTEADVFGTKGGKPTNEAKDYTYGNAPIVPEAMRKTGAFYWLRSAYSTSNVSSVNSSGLPHNYGPPYPLGVRPALWINLS